MKIRRDRALTSVDNIHRITH